MEFMELSSCRGQPRPTSCPARADNSGLGDPSGDLQADLSVQDDLLATLQADLSVQDTLPATLQADLSVQDTLLATFQVDPSVQNDFLAPLQADLSVQDHFPPTCSYLFVLDDETCMTDPTIHKFHKDCCSTLMTKHA